MADAGIHRDMVAALHAEFPGLPITSTYRPGARTRGSNNVSYHARGMAVDMAPRMPVFEWIRTTYPNSRELIYSPAGNLQIWNGKPHVYSGVTKADHYDHIHWAVTSLASAQTGGVPSTGGTPANVAGGGNPFVPDELEAVAAFYKFVTDPGVWVRVGIGLAGGLLLVLAFLGMTKQRLNLSGVLNASK